MKTQLITLLVFCFIATIFAQSNNFIEGRKAFEASNLDAAIEYFSNDIMDNPRSAKSYYSRGFMYLNKSEFANALNDANIALKCIKVNEKRLKANLYELRGLIYVQLDEPEKAIGDFTNAIKIVGTDTDFYIGRSELYYNLKMYDKSKYDLVNILKLDETNAYAIAGLARICIVREQYNEADKLLSKLNKLYPYNETAHYYSAINAYSQNKFDEAIELSFNAFTINPYNKSNRELFLNYAEKNYDYAIAKLTKKINDEPFTHFWLFYKGILQENKEDYYNAVVSFTAAAKQLDITNETIYSHRANCYRNMGMQELAIADYDLVLANDSNRAYDFGYRGDAKRLKGDYAGAVVDFTRAIELEPRETWFYYRRGWINEEFLNNLNDGLNDYNKAIEIDKEYAYTYLHRGMFYKNRLNDLPKANADFEMILKIDTVVISVGNCRQYALLELGRVTEAIEWMNIILKKYPNEDNYYDATCLYSLLGKPVEALMYMTLAFENGYKDIAHLANDNDLDNIRNMSEYNALISKWIIIIEAEIQRTLQVEKDAAPIYKDQSVEQTVLFPMLK